MRHRQSCRYAVPLRTARNKALVGTHSLKGWKSDVAFYVDGNNVAEEDVLQIQIHCEISGMIWNDIF
jgi:hypothetical protein